MTDTPSPPPPPPDVAEIRRRQAERARIMGIALAALCVLFFAITIAKLGLAQ